MAAILRVGALLLATASAVPNVSRLGNKPISEGDHPNGEGQVTPTWPRPHRHGGAAADQYHGPAWIPHGQSLHDHLDQEKTNGGSQLGTHRAPKLPHFLGDGPMPKGKPWGGRTAKHTNYYKDVPNTGMTRHYDFTVTAQDIAPDGVTMSGMVVNGQFPGPTIEANWGDWIEVVVHNNLPNEGTAMHWHGLLQQETPWFDGVPGIDMCPIAPGSTFTYRFRADLYGSSWWHSHYSAQYASGLLGPMIIHGPMDNAEYDADLGPILLNDWYHQNYYELVQQVMAPADEGLLPPVSNNNLINGKMNYPCANVTGGLPCTPNAGISKFYVESGKSYRLRFINAGAEAIQKVSIDGYKMKIIANDFVPIVPYETDVVTLGVGQRTDVIIEASGKPTDAVWLRSSLGKSAFDGGCTLNDGVSPEAVAAIYYENANDTAIPKTTSLVSEEAINTCENDPLDQTVPYLSLQPESDPTSQQMDITYASNGTHNLFFVNNSTFRVDYNDPSLLEAKLGNTNFPAASNIYDFSDSTSIRIVIYNHAVTGAHPMHLHGHNMYVLAVGTGTWDGTIVNPSSPQRRDVMLLPNAPSTTEPSYLVIQYEADNPGVWPLHCHIAWHVSAGLYLNALERPLDIQKQRSIPSIMAQTCRDWSAWTGEHVVDMIDSGL